MSNLDETKVKELLLDVVDYVDQMTRGGYDFRRTEQIRSKIRKADILTDQPPCATIKHQKQPKPLPRPDMPDPGNYPRENGNLYT
jgi:hypothetical protein